MSVIIYNSHYIDGSPTLDYKISINGVKIGLSKEDFADLVQELGSTIADDYKKMLQVSERDNKRHQKTQQLRKDLINVFWDGDVDDMNDFFVKRDIKEIDQERLWKILEDNNRFFGFE